MIRERAGCARRTQDAVERDRERGPTTSRVGKYKVSRLKQTEVDDIETARSTIDQKKATVSAREGKAIAVATRWVDATDTKIASAEVSMGVDPFFEQVGETLESRELFATIDTRRDWGTFWGVSFLLDF